MSTIIDTLGPWLLAGVITFAVLIYIEGRLRR